MRLGVQQRGTNSVGSPGSFWLCLGILFYSVTLRHWAEASWEQFCSAERARSCGPVARPSVAGNSHGMQGRKEGLTCTESINQCVQITFTFQQTTFWPPSVFSLIYSYAKPQSCTSLLAFPQPHEDAVQPKLETAALCGHWALKVLIPCFESGGKPVSEWQIWPSSKRTKTFNPPAFLMMK